MQISRAKAKPMLITGQDRRSKWKQMEINAKSRDGRKTNKN